MKLVIAMGVAMGLAIPSARADDVAAAESEFLRGKELFDEKRFDEACTAFENSERLDPQHGTRYNLALCYQQLGRIASAWRLFRDVAQRDSQASRKRDSDKRAKELEPRLTKLLVVVADPVPGLIVTRDGVDITRLVGIADPVDPAVYRLTARADGYQPWDGAINADAPGTTITVDVPALTAVVVDPAPEVAVIEPPAPAEPPRREEPLEVAEPAPSGPPTWAPWLAIGVAAVSAGVGTYFGMRTLDEEVSFDQASAAAAPATASFIVAGVAGATAVGLFVWSF